MTVTKKQPLKDVSFFLRIAIKYSETYLALKSDIFSRHTVDVVYGYLPETLRNIVLYKTRCLTCGTKEYLIKMTDKCDNEYDAAINAYAHKQGVPKAIENFKVNNVTVNWNIKEDKDKGKLDNNPNKFNNDILKHCNNSDICNKDWGILGCTKLYETHPSKRRLLLKNE